jgi:hypothetical protein
MAAAAWGPHRVICYVIDPDTRTITSADYSGESRDLYRLIGNGCSTFAVVCLDADDIGDGGHGDAVFVDDDGLCRTGARSFRLVVGDTVQPLVGRGIVIGPNPDGIPCAPSRTLDQLRALVRWVD